MELELVTRDWKEVTPSLIYFFSLSGRDTLDVDLPGRVVTKGQGKDR